MVHLIPAILAAACFTQASGAELANLRAEVERPLVVNGEVVDARTVKRFLVYNFGAALLDAHVRRGLLEVYVQSMGQQVPRVGDSLYQSTLSRFERESGDAAIEAAIHAEFGTPEIAQFGCEVNDQFDSYFLPINPNAWTTATLEALKVEADGEVVDDELLRYETNVKAGRPIQPRGHIYQDYLRYVVVGYLRQQFRVSTWSDGLPEYLVLRVEGGVGSSGLELTLDEAFTAILPALDFETVAAERRWAASLVAVRQRLVQDGLLLPRADTDETYEQRNPPSASMFSLADLALFTDYFPSVEHFRAYFQLAQSHDRLFQGDDALLERNELPSRSMPYLKRANHQMGLAKADARLMHFSARDPLTGRFAKDGWATALASAQLAALEIRPACATLTEDTDADEINRIWGDLRDRLSTSHSPPSYIFPAPNPRNSCGGCYTSDRRPLTLHDLRSVLKSSYYKDLQCGNSIAEGVFFDQKPRTLSEPMRTPEGYALAWLIERIPPTHPLRLDEPRHRNLLRQRAARYEFDSYWREAVSSASIR